MGNKLTQTDALSRVTSWAYDAINRPVSRTLPLGQNETYAYDAVGNRTSHTDFNGATHTFNYDANNDWLTTENWADGNSINYSYNAIGQRTAATDANGTFSYSYDNRDRLTSEVKHDGSELLYGYDANGNRTTLTTLVAGVSSTASYAFDALNRMASVTDANGNITSYTFDANSNQTRIDQANGTATTMTFDALNRVTQIAHLDATNAPMATLTYALDPTGRRTAINEANGRTSSYTYDDLYRLTGESISDPDNGTHTSSYQYDAVSNRIQATVNGVSTNYTVDDNDRLLTNGADTYSYDANGNTVSEVVNGQANTYSYDSRNKLVDAVMGGVSQSMAYDPDGARISKGTGGNTVDYLVDSNRDYAQVLVERSGAEELNYTFGLDQVGLDTGAEQYTYHSDALGSTRALSDSAGNVADDIRYDAWGEVLSGGDVAENNYLYTGEQFDSNLNKQYLRARYYSPSLGRFSQMDEWMGSSAAPFTLNKYLYANASPQRWTDPSGNFSLTSLGAASSIKSILGTLSTASTAYDLGSLAYGLSTGKIDGTDLVTIIAVAGASAGAFKLVKVISKKRKLKKMSKNEKKAELGIGSFPKLSNGMTNSEVGRVPNWGTAEDCARKAVKNLTPLDIEYFKSVGINRDDIVKLQKFYDDFQEVLDATDTVGRKKTPKERAKYMKKILKLWK